MEATIQGLGLRVWELYTGYLECIGHTPGVKTWKLLLCPKA